MEGLAWVLLGRRVASLARIPENFFGSSSCNRGFTANSDVAEEFLRCV